MGKISELHAEMRGKNKSSATGITEDSKFQSAETTDESQTEQPRTADDNILTQNDKNYNIKIKLHVDTVKFNKKPEDIAVKQAIKPRMQTKTEPVEITVRELLDKICGGYSISPGVLSGGAKAENWQEQQLFCVDIDNEKAECPILQPNEALKICGKNNIPIAFYYFSFSHTPERPKFRLCFVLNEVITDETKRKAVMTSLLSLFDQADKSCKNADRFFYGTDKSGEILNLSKFADYETIISAFIPSHSGEDREEPKSKTNTNYKTNFDDTELERLKRDFDFFGYLQSRNGDYKNINCGVMFKHCEICGHHDDLVYYEATNTFYCFGANGGKGGTVIDYLMAAENLTLKDAVEKFKYDLCGLEKTPKSEFTQKERRDYARAKHYKDNTDDNLQSFLREIKPDLNYSYNDMGFGALFADVYKNQCRYNVTAKEWYIYNGKIWREDAGAMETSQLAKKLIKNLIVYSASIEDADKQKVFLEYVQKYGQVKYRDTMIKDSRDKFYITKPELDKDLYKFNCQNGTFDLKTFELKPHNSGDLLSKISNVTYDINAESADFEKFINEVMQNDTEKIEYLQKWLGYSLTGDNRLETSLILYGATTRNGKSTLMDAVYYMLGSTSGYAMNMKPETLAQKQNSDSRQASGDIARLDGCRFLNVSEPPKRMIFDIQLLKILLGRDPITARQLYERDFEFFPVFKLFINTNFLPLVTDDTLFSSGRLNVITFDRHFEPHEQDKTLKDRLKKQENISGIFNWCVDGLKKFYKDGLTAPQSVVDSTSEYRHNSDKIGNFISECLEPSKSNTKANEIYEVYQTWCASNGQGTESKPNFFAELKSKNIFAQTGTVDGKTVFNVVLRHIIGENYKPKYNSYGEPPPERNS